MLARIPIISLCLAALAGLATASPAWAADGIQLAQGFKETPLNDLPAVDRDGAAPPRATRPPPPPPVPRAPNVTTRRAPPALDQEAGPPARDTPPPRGASTPARSYEPPPPPRRAAPRYGDPPPARRADRARQPRSSFYANCTQQCHLACEASFEACNGDASPANAECVQKLESCRIQRCSCGFDQ